MRCVQRRFAVAQAAKNVVFGLALLIAAAGTMHYRRKKLTESIWRVFSSYSLPKVYRYVRMYVCKVFTYSRVWINPIRLSIMLGVS